MAADGTRPVRIKPVMCKVQIALHSSGMLQPASGQARCTCTAGTLNILAIMHRVTLALACS